MFLTPFPSSAFLIAISGFIIPHFVPGVIAQKMGTLFRIPFILTINLAIRITANSAHAN
jgi:hypothetical protein